ncbi:MAG: hypothetical protein Q3X77_10665 [Oscillospiraceae bacterium]|uniref:Alginate and motility regulator n=1 Tax=Siphoviridae sp. ctngK14 TaxID=2827940 RepID=A0A8S5TCH8_9CAUD|nr:hypothetical protein [Oscillospiraceae bacterium]DAF60687.1 MAG TPA: Alginate and motility regulator [Siphoviridae sp. ctngK14]
MYNKKEREVSAIAERKYTEAQKKSAQKWDAANLDRVSVAMPKGKKDIIKAHAEANSESVNGFINRAIDEAIERDESAPAASEGQGEA